MEAKEDQHTSTASRKSDGSTEVLVVLADLEISAKVLGCDLAARQNMALEAGVIVCNQE